MDMHRAGRLDEAIDRYMRLCRTDETDADAHYGLGTVLMQRGQLEDAVIHLEKAVERAPSVPEFAFNYALVLERLGRRDAATRELERTAGLATDDRPLRARIAAALAAIERPRKALDLLPVMDATAAEFEVRAQAEIALRRYYAACDSLARATALEPENKGAWLAYAQTLGRIRDYRAAIAAFEKALRITPGTARELHQFADLLLAARQPEAASNLLQQAKRLGIDDPNAIYLEARCARLAGRSERERALLEAAIERRPDFGLAWLQLIETTPDDELTTFVIRCEELGDDDDLRVYDRIALNFAAGRALARLDRHDAAFERFDRANSLQRGDAAARGMRYDAEWTERFDAAMRREFAPHSGQIAATPDGPAPIFIVGMPRSGTTLVERILAGLDGVTAGGESEAVELIAGRHLWDLQQDRTKPALEFTTDDWNRLAELYWRLQLAPRSQITDKMPTNFRHLGLICGMFPRAPIILLRRDPRDVGLSIFSRYFPNGHAYATDLADIAHYTAAAERLQDFWRKRYPDRIFDIAYEQLVASPEDATRELADFCRLEWRPECLDFHTRVDPSFTFSERQVREPVNLQGVGRWRDYAVQLEPMIAALVAKGMQFRDT